MSHYFGLVLSWVTIYSKPCPVGWGCRIRRLHLCRGVRPPLPGPPVGRGWRPVRHYDGILVAVQSLIRWQSVQWLATHYFGPYLVWRAVRLGPIQSISWSCHALAPVCVFLPNVLFHLHLQNNSQSFFIGARRRGLRINCVESRVLTTAKFSGTKTRN